MKFKLPFGKSAPEDFDSLDEDLGDAPPRAREPDDDEEDSVDDDAEVSISDDEVADNFGEDFEDTSPASNGKASGILNGQKRKKLIMIVAALLVVAIGGGVTGYFLVSDGGDTTDQAAQTDADKSKSGGSITMSLAGLNDQPVQPAPMPPPKKVVDNLAQTDTSAGRRPWLQTTADAPDAGTIPGGIDLDGTAPTQAPAEASGQAILGDQMAATPSADPTSAQTEVGAMPAPAEIAPPSDELMTPPQHEPVPPQHVAPAAEPAPTAPNAMPETTTAPSMVPEQVAKGGPIPELVEPPMPTPVRSKELPRPPMWKDLKEAIIVPPLDPAPLDGIHEKTADGLLPIVSEEGVRAWQAYGRPFMERGNGRAAIIVTGLGLRADSTEVAIKSLPAQVTLAFSPYAPNLDEWIGKARARGHEVLISIPMESNNFPARDPGPYGLLTLLSAEENLGRLDKVMGRTTGYVGVIGERGERFLSTSQFISPVLKQLGERGLLYVDNGAGIKAAAVAPRGLPHATSEIIIDEKLFKESIQARLRYITNIAQARGQVTAIASATPVSMMAIKEWAAGLAPTKVELAPITAVVTQ